MYITDAQTFYVQLKNQEKINCLPPSNEFINVLIGFCSARSPKTVFGKINLVKGFIKSCVKLGLVGKLKVGFKFFKSGIASMYDDGKIVFYKDFLFKQTYIESLVATLHEVSHAFLWSSDSYQDLLTCDKEFFDKYVKDSSQTVVCPVEYYANQLTLKWLDLAVNNLKDQDRIDKLKDVYNRLEQKILIAKEKV
ncbi:MAG: hypothetical protein II988_02525 [Clostridia bacterium]|nr:hypothetical protein [Clostridia bacterium]